MTIVRRVRPAVVAAFFAAGGCAHLPHPAVLAGQWVDQAHATPADTAIWVLEVDGRDRLVHVTVDPAGTATVSPPRAYGTWYLQGALADSAGRALCIVRRPGRDAGACSPFVMDTVEVQGRAMRRLRLLGYQGEHIRADRVLVERRP